jgi:quercetin dioxygenase-like cupin family protein
MSTIQFLDTPARVLATGGALGLVDMLEAPSGSMPPLHVHRNEDEGFYVLEGKVSLFMPGERIDLEPGDYAVAPRGVPHAYRVGDTPARWLVTSTPAGFERFVADVGGLDSADPAALTEIAAEHGIEILGPPGMLP